MLAEREPNGLRGVLRALLALKALSILLPSPAYAYIDPGTGSILFQVLMAGLFAALFFLRRILGAIKEVALRILGWFSPR